MALDWATFTLDEWNGFTLNHWDTFLLDPAGEGLTLHAERLGVFCAGGQAVAAHGYVDALAAFAAGAVAAQANLLDDDSEPFTAG
jgi:hypothetical protein